MKNWYEEWRDNIVFLPDEFYEKTEEMDDYTSVRKAKNKNRSQRRECIWLRNRNYKFNQIKKLYEFHFVRNEDRDDLKTVVFSYSLPNYYIPDRDNKPTRVKRLTGEHHYVFGSSYWWKKYKKRKTNRSIRHNGICKEIPSKNKKHIKSQFNYTFD